MSALLLLGAACGDEEEKADRDDDEGEEKADAEEAEPVEEEPVHAPSEFSPKMIEVQAKPFTMGKRDFDRKAQRDEGAHYVDFSGFSYMISETEVTQQLYESVMQVNPSEHLNPLAPVDSVSWREAALFCNKLSEMENLTPVYQMQGETVRWTAGTNGYRLPTEAEWEYAARANEDLLYSGSSKIEEVAWTKKTSKKTTHPVGLKTPNALGLHDMSGNVYEWVWDWHQCGTVAFDTFKTCNGDFPVVEKFPTGWSSGTEKVFRGGSYKNHYSSSRVTNRGFYKWDKPQSNVGMRLARSVTPYPEDVSSIVAEKIEPTHSVLWTSYGDSACYVGLKDLSTGKEKSYPASFTYCGEGKPDLSKAKGVKLAVTFATMTLDACEGDYGCGRTRQGLGIQEVRYQ